MNESDRQTRISQLHNHRHVLLQQRNRRDAPIDSIDMELNVVRSELQALYEFGRVAQKTPTPRSAATHSRIA